MGISSSVVFQMLRKQKKLMMPAAAVLPSLLLARNPVPRELGLLTTQKTVVCTSEKGYYFVQEDRASLLASKRWQISRMFLSGIAGIMTLAGSSQWAMAEQVQGQQQHPTPSSIPAALSVNSSEQEVQLVEESLQSSEQPAELQSNSHTARWRIYTDMGRDLCSKGRLDEAEKYFVRAVEEAKKGFGDRDPHVASSCNNLAELYRMKREHANAEPLFVEAVQRLEQALGPEHPSVGFTLHNLASTYLQQRKFEEAQSCYEIKEKTLGPNHPEYANTMFHLASVLQLQGNISDAEHLIRDSLRILEEGGVGHSQTALRRMSRLAEILVHSGQLQEAEILQRKILHILELLQGPDSLSTIMAVDNLATTLQALRKLDEAEELFDRCLQVRLKALSPSHILVGSTLYKRALVTSQRADGIMEKGLEGKAEAMADYETAQEMLRQSIRIAEQRWEEALDTVVIADAAATANLSTAANIGPKVLSALTPPLLALVRALNALAVVEIRQAELADTHAGVEEGKREAERVLRHCLFLLDKPPGVVEELLNIPEIQRELFACLQRLAALLTQNQGQGRSTSNSGAAHEAALLLSRAETVKAKYLTPKTSSLPNA
ncbi:unnamed protein product [Sphagnum balticum]